MKIKIDIGYDETPKKCKDCKFIESHRTNFGRTFTYFCSLTTKGLIECEGSIDKSRAERMMRDSCPIKIEVKRIKKKLKKNLKKSLR